MERSIENIWKEGFESNKSFDLPVMKDLYKRKSKLIINKIKSTSRKDNISLIPIAIFLFAIFAFLDRAMLGTYLGFLILLLFILNKRMLKKLDQVDLTSNTYQYLKNYYSQLKGIQRYYTRLLAIGLPILIIPGYWMYFQGTAIMAGFNSLDVYIQVLLLGITAIILSGLGVFCYRLSTHIVYGKLIARLKEVINDMETLMKK